MLGLSFGADVRLYMAADEPASAAPAEGQQMTASEWAALGLVPNPLAVAASPKFTQYDGKLSPTTVAAIERIHGRAQGSRD